MSKTKTKTAILVDTGDYWQALYINGKLVYEAHEITIKDLQHYKIAQSVKSYYVDDEWLSSYNDPVPPGGMPEKLSDIILNKG